MTVAPILLPYTLSRRDFGTARGPEHLMRGGLDALLNGRAMTAATLELPADADTDVEAIFAAARLISEQTASAEAHGLFPLVLAGNCSATIGAISGLSKEGLGLVWLDAHGDFNTPETTVSGFLDGMGLAVVAGLCWTAIAATVPGFAPLAEERIAHLGGRSFDTQEAVLLSESKVIVREAEAFAREGIAPVVDAVLDSLALSGVSRVYLHLDLDVFDPAEAPANHYSTGKGLSVNDVMAVVRSLAARFPLAGCTVSSFAPDCDPDGRTVRAALSTIDTLLTAASQRESAAVQ